MARTRGALREPGRMPRALRALLALVVFGVFLGGGIVVSLLVLPLCRAGGRSRASQARRDREVLRACYVRFIALLRALGLVAYAGPVLPADRPRGACVIVANHPSLVDVLFIQAAVPDLTAVIKASWLRAPILGRVARRCGYVAGPERSAAHPGADDPGAIGVGHWGQSIGVGHGQSIGEPAVVLERIAEVLRAGTSVLVFPEGTRSPPGELRRFKVGACEAARLAGVPVWPFVVEVDGGARLGRGWFAVPDDVVRVHLSARPPLDPRDWPDARSMNRALRARYEAWLGVRTPAQDVAPGLTPARTEV